MKIRIVTVVWGDEFVSLFLRVALRSLLAAGNIPDLAKTNQITYLIYTTKADVITLERSEVFAELRQHVKFELSCLSPVDLSRAVTATHHVFWAKGLELARRNNEALILVIPDLLYGRGTLLAWCALLDQGYGAVFTPGPFVALETTLQELNNRFPPHLRVIDLQGYEIHELLLKHLHPLEACMLHDAPRRVIHPEHFISVVPGHGLLLRALTSQPFCLNPGSFDRIQYQIPQDHLSSICFAPCTTVSLEPMLKSANWYYRPRPADESFASSLGAWWSIFGSPACVRESMHTYDIGLASGNYSQAYFETVNARCSSFRDQLKIATFEYKLWQSVRDAGCSQLASLIALAHHVTEPQQRFTFPDGSIFLVPNDFAFGDEVRTAISNKLASQGASFLSDFLRDHVLVPHTIEANDAKHEWKLASGKSYISRKGGVEILSSSIPVEGVRLYVIDEILGEEFSTFFSKKNQNSQQAEYGGMSHSNLSNAEIDHDSVVLTSNYFKERLSRVLRLFISALELLPSGKRAVTHLNRAQVIYSQERWEGLRQRIIARFFRLPMLRRFIDRAWILFPRIMRTIVLIRRYGLRTVIWHARRKAYAYWMNKVGRRLLLLGERARRASNESMQKIQQVRVLQAASEVLNHYEASINMADHPGPPLALITKRLSEIGPDRKLVESQIEKHLNMMATKYPGWAKAWLELGYFELDRGDLAAAMNAFKRASSARQYRFGEEAERDSKFEAYACQARIYATGGQTHLSSQLFESALACNGDDVIVNREYAFHLWKSGDVWQAAARFDKAMGHETEQFLVPPMPRSILQLDLSHFSSSPPF